ncbi:MAG TPA: hypothetical protein VGM74_10050 [Burkholderiaceae bacterium]
MISFPPAASTGNSLMSYLSAQNAGSGSSPAAAAGTNANANASVNARVAATAQAALLAAGTTHPALTAEHALDKQQATLAGDLRTALGKAGVALGGPIEYSVGSDGSVSMKGSDADKTAMTAFLKADTGNPSFATRIATQARDALKLSATIQQHAAISQAARYGGKAGGGVMSLYTSLMQQSAGGVAVFSFSADASSLSYPGSLAAKA